MLIIFEYILTKYRKRKVLSLTRLAKFYLQLWVSVLDLQLPAAFQYPIEILRLATINFTAFTTEQESNLPSASRTHQAAQWAGPDHPLLYIFLEASFLPHHLLNHVWKATWSLHFSPNRLPSVPAYLAPLNLLFVWAYFRFLNFLGFLPSPQIHLVSNQQRCVFCKVSEHPFTFLMAACLAPHGLTPGLGPTTTPRPSGLHIQAVHQHLQGHQTEPRWAQWARQNPRDDPTRGEHRTRTADRRGRRLERDITR